MDLTIVDLWRKLAKTNEKQIEQAKINEKQKQNEHKQCTVKQNCSLNNCNFHPFVFFVLASFGVHLFHHVFCFSCVILVFIWFIISFNCHVGFHLVNHVLFMCHFGLHLGHDCLYCF